MVQPAACGRCERVRQAWQLRQTVSPGCTHTREPSACCSACEGVLTRCEHWTAATAAHECYSPGRQHSGCEYLCQRRPRTGGGETLAIGGAPRLPSALDLTARSRTDFVVPCSSCAAPCQVQSTRSSDAAAALARRPIVRPYCCYHSPFALHCNDSPCRVLHSTRETLERAGIGAPVETARPCGCLT